MTDTPLHLRSLAAGIGLVLLAFAMLTSFVGAARADQFTTPGAYTYTVPAGVTQVRVQVAGAGGGQGGDDDQPGGAGGKGLLFVTTLNVTPGQVITGVVGGKGAVGVSSFAGDGTPNTPGGTGAAPGGTGGRTGATGVSGRGGGGGGGTSLVTNGITLLKAGGGGGGGGGSQGNPGLAGGNAIGFVTVGNCSTNATGGAGGNFVGTDGAGGGGGGGGYAAGTGGSAHADLVPALLASTGGGSCYTTASANFTATPVMSLSPATGASASDPPNGYVVIEALLEVSITKSNGATTVPSGGTSTYTVRVTNNGPYTTAGILLTDPMVATLPKQSVSCSPTPGACVTPPSVAQLESGTFALPSMAANGFYEIQVTVSVQPTSATTVANAAWTQVPASYGTTGSTCTNTSLPAGVTRAFDSSTLRCTVTDTDTPARANITLRKATLADAGANQGFAVTSPNLMSATGTTINASTAATITGAIVNSGAVTTLTEAGVAGWAGAGFTCVATTGVNGQVNGATVFTGSTLGVPGAAYSVSIPAGTFISGNTYDCSFTNAHARLRYQAATVPAGIAQDFTVGVFNGRPAATINASGAATAYAAILTPQAAASFSQTALSGWTAQGVSCVADTGNFGVAAGSTVFAGSGASPSVPGGTFIAGNDYTCTFTNATTTLTLVQATAPAANLNQDFSVTPGNFTSNTTVLLNAGNGTTVTRMVADNAVATTLNVAAVAGWRHASLACVATSASGGETLGRAAYSGTVADTSAASVGAAFNNTIPAGRFIAGNTYTCTFTSEAVMVRYAKTTLPGAVAQDFSIAAANGLAATTINATTGFSAYQRLTDQKVATTFTEAAVAGWRGTGIACVADTANNGVAAGSTAFSSTTPNAAAGTAFSATAAINSFMAGNAYTCTFTNDRTRLRLAKATTPAGSNQAFVVNASASNGIGSATINASGAASAYQVLTNPTAATVLTETGVTAWRGSGVTCVADTAVNGAVVGGTAFTSSTPGTVGANYVATIGASAFVPGNDYTCTISNETTRLRYGKATLPQAAQNVDFTVAAFAGIGATTVNAATGATPYALLTPPASNTNLTENAMTGWQALSLTCVADTARNGVVLGSTVLSNATAGTLNAAYSTTVLPTTFVPGNDYTCTWTNGSAMIRFAKTTLPASISQDFSVGAVNGLAATTINATTGFSAYQRLANPAATTAFAEAAATGWRGVSLVCVADTANNGVTLGSQAYSNTTAGTAGTAFAPTAAVANAFRAGNAYTCTFSNDRTRLRFAKVTRPGAVNQNFIVNATTSNGIASTTINASTASSAYQGLGSVAAATTVTESAVTGWRGASVSCVADTAIGGVVAGSTVFSSSTGGTISTAYSTPITANTFVAGNDYTCTIINETTRLRYAEVTLPANQDVTFTIAAFNGVPVTTVNPTTGPSAYAMVDASSAGFLTQNAQAGWTAQGLRCVADTSNNSEVAGTVVVTNTGPGLIATSYTTTVPANALKAGNDYTCTFTNAGIRLTIAKVTAPMANVNQDFTISSITSVVESGPGIINAGTGATVTRTAAAAGLLTVITEVVPPGWAAASVTCVATTGNGTETIGTNVPVVLALSLLNTYTGTILLGFKQGNAYTCTFTNTSTMMRLAKATLPASINQNFTVNGATTSNGIGSATINATAGASTYQGIADIAAATTLIETGVPGWRGQSVTCVADTNVGLEIVGRVAYTDSTLAPTRGGDFSKTIGANTFRSGNAYTCTFTNNAFQVRYRKLTAPMTVDQNFTVSTTAGAADTVINATGGTSPYQVLTNIAATQTFTETGVASWRGGSLNCVADTSNNTEIVTRAAFANTTPGAVGGNFVSTVGFGNTSAANTLVAGNAYTCTFTNQAAMVRLGKQTTPTIAFNQSFTNEVASNGLTAGMSFNAATGPSGYVIVTDPAAVTAPRESAGVTWRGVGMTCRRDSDLVTVYTTSNAGQVNQPYTPTAIPGGTFVPGVAYTCTLTNQLSSPALTKAFGALAIPLGGTANLTFTISSIIGTAGQSGLSFTDTLPSGLVLASAPTASQCGGTVSGTAGGNTISFAGGSIGAGPAACTITVSVTTAAGQGQSLCPSASLTNGSANITAISAGLYNGVTDQCLPVGPPQLSLRIAKVTQGSTGMFTFTGGVLDGNGFPSNGSYTVTTSTPGTAANGVSVPLTLVGVTTSIAETLLPGWTLVSAACEDINAALTGNPVGPVIGTVSDGRTLVIPGSNVRVGTQLVCTFTNSFAGPTLAGRVLVDNGIGLGTAHNGVADGTEAGLAGVTVQLTNCGATVFAEAVTAGDGRFSLPLAGPANGATVCVVRAPLASYIGVSRNAGSTGGSIATPAYSTLSSTYAAGTNYTGVVFGVISLPALAADNTATTGPGSAVLLPHQFTATSRMTVLPTIVNAAGSPSAAPFTAIVYRDIDCSGTLDLLEQPVTGGITLDAGVQLCLLVRVEVAAGTAPGATYGYDLVATTALGSTLATLAPLSNHDQVTVVAAGSITLVKRVRNVTTGGLLGTTSTGNPGDVLQYVIVFANPSAAPVTNVTVFDQTPSYTSLFAPPGASVLLTPPGMSCGVTVPASGGSNGYVGPVQWTCTGTMSPGTEGRVAFQVQIDQ